jgi:hypothetical protein
MSKDVSCPYCEADIEICHDDGYGYDESQKHSQSCGKCGKSFGYTTSISFDYDAFKADCIDIPALHKWEPSKTFPTYLKQMQCSVCGEERRPTAEEKIQYKIPTYEEYLKQYQI